jgi:hypothetical protein
MGVELTSCITRPGRTYPWTRTRRRVGRCKRQALGPSLLYRKSGDFIIGTNVGPRELAGQGIVAYGHSGGTLPLFGWRALGAIGHLASRHRQRVRPKCRRHCDPGTFA